MSAPHSSAKQTILISLITAFCLLGDSMLYIVLPLFWKQFGLDALWQVGVLLCVNRLVRLPFNPMALSLSNILGQKKCFYIAVFLAFITTFSYSFVTGFYSLLIARTFWGIAWSFLRLGSYFSILQISGISERGYHMGLYNGIFRLGSLFGMLGGALIAEFITPLAAGYIFSGFALFALPIVFFRIPKNTLEKTNKESFSYFSLLLSNKVIFALFCTSFLTALIYQGVFTSTLSYLVSYNDINFDFLKAYGLGSASFAGILQAVRWLWEPFLAPKIGFISDGFKDRRFLLKQFCLFSAILFLLIAQKLNLWLWLTIIMLIQISATGITTLVDATAADIASTSQKSNSILAAHSFFIDLGSALGPVIAYFFISYVGFNALFLAVFTCLLIVLFVWHRLDKPQKRIS